MNKRVVVTGGGGFIGSYLVKRLVRDGWDVGVIDNMIRGDVSRIADVAKDVRLHSIDVRDEDAVTAAVAGADVVMHLAAINGTENFYTQPELVLDVGIRGAIAVANACRRASVPDLVVASTAEVYQTPKHVPTSEETALMLPDSLNPRYSYGGSKIVSELIAFNYGRDHFRKVQVFRPHNVYGPNMGWKHVIPQLILRGAEAIAQEQESPTITIQGDGYETRAFAYVDDVVDGILTMYDKGKHREIYHIGNDDEVSIRDLVGQLGNVLGRELNILTSDTPTGGTLRRCPNLSKMRALGYLPRINLNDGLKKTVKWYLDYKCREKTNKLM